MYKVNEQEVDPVEVEKGITIQTLIAPDDGALNFAMRLFKVAPHAHTPLHRHPWEHEVFVLRGDGLLKYEEKEYAIGAGDAILVPAEAEHNFRSVGAGELAFICVIPNSGARV